MKERPWILVVGLLAATATAAESQYDFDGTPSRPVLENYLARSITAMDLITAAARNNGTWTGGAINLGCALLTSTDVSGGTVNGGTTTNSDATDGWGVVGFALIGTTPSYQPRYGFVHYNDPGLL